jgi:hypothetical protein
MRINVSVRNAAYLVITIVLIAAVLAVRAQTGNTPSQVGSASSSTSAATQSGTASQSATAAQSVVTSPATTSTGVSVTACGSSARSELSIEDGVNPTVANWTRASQMVAIGTVISIGPARWNTADGSEPAFTAQGNPPAWAEIYRHVTLSIQRTAKGAVATVLTARLLGGTVNCYTYSRSGAPAPAVNGSYAVFLGVSTDSTGFTTTQLTLFDAWPVAADGTITTPMDGTLSVAAFVSAVQAAP